MASHNSQDSEKPVIKARQKFPPQAVPRVKLQNAKPSVPSISKDPELVLRMVRFYVGEVIPGLQAALEKSEKEKRQLKADVKRLVGAVRELGDYESACLRNDWDVSAHHSMCEREDTSREHDGIGSIPHL